MGERHTAVENHLRAALPVKGHRNETGDMGLRRTAVAHGNVDIESEREMEECLRRTIRVLESLPRFQGSKEEVGRR
jgi:hypothetical protein